MRVAATSSTAYAYVIGIRLPPASSPSGSVATGEVPRGRRRWAADAFRRQHRARRPRGGGVHPGGRLTRSTSRGLPAEHNTLMTPFIILDEAQNTTPEQMNDS